MRAWSNEGRGVPVLISNGLGTPHDAWPTINEQTDTYRVVTWDHRGLGGSDRPADESRITISDHTDDLIAVMDSYGIDRAVVIGWSAEQRSKRCFLPFPDSCARGRDGRGHI